MSAESTTLWDLLEVLPEDVPPSPASEEPLTQEGQESPAPLPAAPVDVSTDDDSQPLLFELPPSWVEHWTGMPDYAQKNLKPYDSINVQFRNAEDRRAFLMLLGEHPERQRSIWYPKMDVLWVSTKNAGKVSVSAGRYPVYVPTKGRWESALTIKALEQLGLHYYAVVQPQEADAYRPLIESGEILTLPVGLDGLVPARNWIREHAINLGAERHWQLDDNIAGFYRLNNNLKVKVTDFNPLIPVEDFADRYTNVVIAGMQYEFFADRRAVQPPFYWNARVYSCSLVSHAFPYQWRGVYNDDTDICLRILKDGHCTVLFNAILCKKMPTLKVSGGNTPIYQGDGRLKMAESLRDQHPDCVTITEKWGRPQHHVDYSRFRNNKPILKESFINNQIVSGGEQP